MVGDKKSSGVPLGDEGLRKCPDFEKMSLEELFEFAEKQVPEGLKVRDRDIEINARELRIAIVNLYKYCIDEGFMDEEEARDNIVYCFKDIELMKQHQRRGPEDFIQRFDITQDLITAIEDSLSGIEANNKIMELMTNAIDKAKTLLYVITCWAIAW